jgi:hypothetical protein
VVVAVVVAMVVVAVGVGCALSREVGTDGPGSGWAHATSHRSGRYEWARCVGSVSDVVCRERYVAHSSAGEQRWKWSRLGALGKLGEARVRSGGPWPLKLIRFWTRAFFFFSAYSKYYLSMYRRYYYGMPTMSSYDGSLALLSYSTITTFSSQPTASHRCRLSTPRRGSPTCRTLTYSTGCRDRNYCALPWSC